MPGSAGEVITWQGISDGSVEGPAFGWGKERVGGRADERVGEFDSDRTGLQQPGRFGVGEPSRF
jgi:hypothetical protein